MEICFDDNGAVIHTPIQERLTDMNKSYYTTNPQLCDLVCTMLHYDPEKRPDAHEIIKRAAEMKCRVMKQISSQISIASSNSNTSSTADLEKSYPLSALSEWSSWVLLSYVRMWMNLMKTCRPMVCYLELFSQKLSQKRGDNSKLYIVQLED